jgi:hypothetical protein
MAPASGIGSRPCLAEALAMLARELCTEPAVLAGPDRGREIAQARALAAYTLVRQLGYPASGVAAALGRPVSSLSVLLSRFADRIDAKPARRSEPHRLAEMLRKAATVKDVRV